jgi:hypothetical protein
MATGITCFHKQRPLSTNKQNQHHASKNKVRINSHINCPSARTKACCNESNEFSGLPKPAPGKLAHNDDTFFIAQPLKEFGYFRSLFDKARDAAEQEAKELGISFERFQFRDLRPKTVSDIDAMHDIKAAQKFYDTQRSK